MQWKLLVFFHERGEVIFAELVSEFEIASFWQCEVRAYFSLSLPTTDTFAASLCGSLSSEKGRLFLVSNGSCQKKYQCLCRPLSPYFFRHSCLFVSLASRLEMRNGLEKTCFLLENVLKKLLKTSKMGKKTRKCPRFWFFCRVKDFPRNSRFFLCFRDLREMWLRVAGA